jgi:hypothetical protein
VEVRADAAEAAPAGAAGSTGSTGTEEPSAAESTDAADGAEDGAWADPRDFGAIARDQLAALRAAGAALG